MLIETFANEKALLQQVAAGNEQAFRCLFMQYHQLLATHIYRITESAEVAEEIVQDVFLKIWLNRHTLLTVANFKAYLFVASKNHALNELRKIVRERIKQNSYITEAIRHNNELTEVNHTYYALLDKAIDQLPAQQKKVYLLSRHERLKYTEIGQRLGISTESVKKYLQLAKSSINGFLLKNQEVSLSLLLIIKFL
ncbi:sigma-70 family RNA polymerase sigma factor [Mucilaginibacter sp. Bleaf8]|uniref:RNA polymerase sigma factor n=1 Tax=Mucilaginibacter sp. Bleaf8 TaxID=2834430 RepID=UPI001BCAF902|nr:sigma-70 family RNA polymerase sigma factor [Mucilaginibacter sp. Bleaf8]MBS7563890.1 sigma-70 family RNA polymerase sigma factor [Mucilaginibacter sp. Bleaf8]